jgi:hypothetical protein
MKFTIPYPENKTEQTAWNKNYGMNAIYSRQALDEKKR